MAAAMGILGLCAIGCGRNTLAYEESIARPLTASFLIPDSRWTTRKQPDGVAAMGASDPVADDGFVAELRLKGHPEMAAADRVGPRYASEIVSVSKFGYGLFRARFQPAVCTPTEEAVTAFFVYDNDGTDRNANGMIDNTEIDIEHLCGQPELLWLTTWTDYTDGQHLRKKSRGINLRTGDYRETPDGLEGTYDLSTRGHVAGIAFPTFPVAGAYYEIGFHWTLARIRWFIVIEGVEVTLWDLRMPELVPRRTARILMNLWHSSTHWAAPGAADYPADDAVARFDWVRFDANLWGEWLPTPPSP